MWKVTLILCMIGQGMAQSPSLGSCPQVETVQSLDLNKYSGKWYEASRFFTIFEIGGKCVTAEYTLNPNGSVKVVNSQISSFTGNVSSIEGTASVVDSEEPGKLAVHFPSIPINNSGSYWVLGTDYDSYAVVWSCTSLKVANLQFSWILTREQNPSESVIQKAYDVLNANKLDVTKFLKTDQINCTVN